MVGAARSHRHGRKRSRRQIPSHAKNPADLRTRSRRPRSPPQKKPAIVSTKCSSPRNHPSLGISTSGPPAKPICTHQPQRPRRRKTPPTRLRASDSPVKPRPHGGDILTAAPPAPGWRNWQTQRTQNPPALAVMGVRPPLPAPSKENEMTQMRLLRMEHWRRRRLRRPRSSPHPGAWHFHEAGLHRADEWGDAHQQRELNCS